MLSDIDRDWSKFKINEGLNPCSNGICSLTFKKSSKQFHSQVLILVLMEYAL